MALSQKKNILYYIQNIQHFFEARPSLFCFERAAHEVVRHGEALEASYH